MGDMLFGGSVNSIIDPLREGGSIVNLLATPLMSGEFESKIFVVDESPQIMQLYGAAVATLYVVNPYTGTTSQFRHNGNTVVLSNTGDTVCLLNTPGAYLFRIATISLPAVDINVMRSKLPVTLQGQSGTAGVAGTQGATGVAGAQGAAGVAGTDATLAGGVYSTPMYQYTDANAIVPWPTAVHVNNPNADFTVAPTGVVTAQAGVIEVKVSFEPLFTGAWSYFRIKFYHGAAPIQVHEIQRGTSALGSFTATASILLMPTSITAGKNFAHIQVETDSTDCFIAHAELYITKGVA